MSEMLCFKHFGYFKTQKRKDTDKTQRLCIFASLRFIYIRIIFYLE